MLVTRAPASTASQAENTPSEGIERGAPPRPQAWWLTAASLALRLLLLGSAGAVMQLGWIMVWTLSYRLTHGNDFTYVYLVSQSAVWEKLHELLQLGNTLAPGFELAEGPASLDIVVNSLVFGFVVAGVGYLCAVMLVDLGVCAVRGALLVVVVFEIGFQITLFLTPGL